MKKKTAKRIAVVCMCLLALTFLALPFGMASAETTVDVKDLIDALPEQFFSWNILGTFAGAVLAVTLITQLTKDLPYIKKIPTQLWSYILAVVVLLAAQTFNGALTLSNAVLCLANGLLVSLGANGSYTAITRVSKLISSTSSKKDDDVDILNLDTWSIEDLKSFCVLYNIYCDDCKTKEDYIKVTEALLAEDRANAAADE